MCSSFTDLVNKILFPFSLFARLSHCAACALPNEKHESPDPDTIGGDINVTEPLQRRQNLPKTTDTRCSVLLCLVFCAPPRRIPTGQYTWPSAPLNPVLHRPTCCQANHINAPAALRRGSPSTHDAMLIHYHEATCGNPKRLPAQTGLTSRMIMLGDRSCDASSTSNKKVRQVAP